MSGDNIDWAAIASQLESSVAFLEREERRHYGTSKHVAASRDVERARASLVTALKNAELAK